MYNSSIFSSCYDGSRDPCASGPFISDHRSRFAVLIKPMARLKKVIWVKAPLAYSEQSYLTPWKLELFVWFFPSIHCIGYTLPCIKLYPFKPLVTGLIECMNVKSFGAVLACQGLDEERWTRKVESARSYVCKIPSTIATLFHGARSGV